MILDIEGDIETEIGWEILDEMERVTELTLKREGFYYEAEISLNLVSDDEIQRLNKKFRQKDCPTDVLSFPAYDLSEGDYSALAKVAEPILLGDIVISTERAFAQADEFGHTPLREFCFLTVHSVLHLLGYDHMDENEMQAMFAKQSDILEEAGIERSAGISAMPTLQS